MLDVKRPVRVGCDAGHAAFAKNHYDTFVIAYVTDSPATFVTDWFDSDHPLSIVFNSITSFVVRKYAAPLICEVLKQKNGEEGGYLVQER